MRKAKSHPDQLAMSFGKDSEMERMIEARVAIRAEADAIRWRFRLILIETAMLGVMVSASGWVLGQSAAVSIRSTLLVAAACLASGLILVGLSGGVSMLVSHSRRWKAGRAPFIRWGKRS